MTNVTELHEFFTPAAWIKNTISIVLVGAGGTGGEIFDRLHKLHTCHKAIGGEGIHVTVYDDDTVSSSNIGKQRFWPTDVGLHKARLLVERVNLFGGLSWDFMPRKFTTRDFDNLTQNTLLVTATDSAKFRLSIGQRFAKSRRELVWIDSGNDDTTGQVIMGARGYSIDLPSVYDLHSDSLKAAKPTSAPSCSTREALTRQDLMVNCFMADATISLVWQLMRMGSLKHHGAIVDIRNFEVSPLAIDTKIWRSINPDLKLEKAA